MRALKLDISSKSFLTKTLPGSRSYLCDLEGNEIPAPGLPIYRDTFTAKTFVQVTERIPSGNSTADVAERVRIAALNPIHFASPTGKVNGWFVEAPDFNGREGK